MLHATVIPINLLQSQLAHNKNRINELQRYALLYKSGVKYINIQVKYLEDDIMAQDYTCTLLTQKIDYLKELQKTRKQLKQLAILQKSIKTSISLQVLEEAYLNAEYNNIGV